LVLLPVAILKLLPFGWLQCPLIHTGEAERLSRREAERHSAINPNSIAADRWWLSDCKRLIALWALCAEAVADDLVIAMTGNSRE